MAINFKIITVTVLVYTVTVFANCKKHVLGCPESSYSFIIDAQVLPDKDTISIGDTVWVEINSSDVFTDQNSSRQVNFSDAANLGTDMGFARLVSTSPVQLANAVNDFDYILLAGKEIASANPTLIKMFLISDINGMYRFKLGIIAKNRGTYRFNLGNAVGVYRKGDPCPKADFEMRLVQTDQHYYLYPGGTGVTPSGADYYFYVK